MKHLLFFAVNVDSYRVIFVHVASQIGHAYVGIVRTAVPARCDPWCGQAVLVHFEELFAHPSQDVREDQGDGRGFAMPEVEHDCGSEAVGLADHPPDRADDRGLGDSDSYDTT